MDWMIAYDKEEYFLIIYQYDNKGFFGNSVLKIPIENILKKYKAISTFIDENYYSN